MLLVSEDNVEDSDSDEVVVVVADATSHKRGGGCSIASIVEQQ